MPLPDDFPWRLLHPELERMITMHPVQYMQAVRGLGDPFLRNLSLRLFLDRLQDDQWVHLRDAGIFPFIEEAVQCTVVNSQVSTHRFRVIE